MKVKSLTEGRRRRLASQIRFLGETAAKERNAAWGVTRWRLERLGSCGRLRRQHRRPPNGVPTAGMEASGTGNMKLALNGALTIGTLDGANIEIGEEVGDDNIFIFGHTASEVTELRSHGYNPWDYYHGNAELKEALDMLSSGYFCPDEPHRFQPIVDTLTTHGDHYLLLADYASYIECQDKVDALYRDTDEWTRKAILNVAGMGKFSSDRTISQYAEEIWEVKPMAPRQRNGEESV